MARFKRQDYLSFYLLVSSDRLSHRKTNPERSRRVRFSLRFFVVHPERSEGTIKTDPSFVGMTIKCKNCKSLSRK